MNDDQENEHKIKIPDGMLSPTQLPDLSAIQKSLQPAFEMRERMQGMLKDLQPAIDMALLPHPFSFVHHT